MRRLPSMRGAAFAVALLGVPLAVGAQEGRRTTLVAAVADAKTGAPIEGAEVVIAELGQVAPSDARGHARLTGIAPGSYYVRARHLGHKPKEIQLRMAGDSVESLFLLETSVQELDTVRVASAPVPMYLQSFETRRKMGIGRFITERDLDKEGNREFVSVAVTRFPGLKDVFDTDGRHRLASMRGSCGVARALPKLNGGGRDTMSSCFSNRPCLLQVFLDDMSLGEEEFDIIRTWDLAGVEFYSGGSMPPKYRVDGSACGVLLLWSKRGDR